MNTIIFNIEDDAQFTAFTPVVAPLGEPVSLTRTALDVETDQALMGIWECTPGTWRRQVLQAEYSYFIAGSGRFLHDNGEVIHFQAGDGVYFPAGSTGTWEIEDLVRKSYVIFK